MFTGLIQSLATVKEIAVEADGRKITIQNSGYQNLVLGESIAINGACQTVDQIIDAKSGTFTVFSVPETLSVTNFLSIQAGDRVNLERAMLLGERFGGHMLLGHIEGRAKVLSILKKSQFWRILLSYDSPYLVPKGSVGLEGISLTIHRSEGPQFEVEIIPETLERTNIKNWKVGFDINIECDYIIKAIDHANRYRLNSLNK